MLNVRPVFFSVRFSRSFILSTSFFGNGLRSPISLKRTLFLIKDEDSFFIESWNKDIKKLTSNKHSAENENWLVNEVNNLVEKYGKICKILILRIYFLANKQLSADPLVVLSTYIKFALPHKSNISSLIFLL